MLKQLLRSFVFVTCCNSEGSPCSNVNANVLRLSRNSLSQIKTGDLVNLLSNDVNRFDLVSKDLNFLWISPLQLIISGFLTWYSMGISAVIGIVTMLVLMMPLQAFCAKVAFKIRSKIASATDKRIRLIAEIIGGIRIIKIFAWEKPYENKVKIARKEEIRLITIANYMRATLMSTSVVVERLCLYATIIAYVLFGNSISPNKIFLLAQLFGIIQRSFGILFPISLALSGESLSSIRRLQNFLYLEEKSDENMHNCENKAIILNNLTADMNGHNLTLNLKLAPGILCAVVGTIGSGKSSLFQLLLGELPIKTGTLKIGGSISYCSQEPWLFRNTIKNNIIIGENFNLERYNQILKVCALRKDFQLLPDGQDTLVGEKGISLSGGQRARINLARAVYRNADIYLLDDPLSAVDTRVANHLFEKCILEHLRNKTRILVTHQIQFLTKTDLIIVINKGQIEAVGTFKELTRSNSNFTKMLVSHDDKYEEEDEKIQSKLELSLSLDESIQYVKRKEIEDDDKIIIKVSVWKEYFKSTGSWCIFVFVAVITILSQSINISCDFWVSFWSYQEHTINLLKFRLNAYNPNTEKFRDINLETNYIDNVTAIYIYTGLIIFVLIFNIMKDFLSFNLTMKASKNLHFQMFHSILQAPMKFFDVNSKGEILNRFSKDMGEIDEILPKTLCLSIQIAICTLVIILLIIVTNVYMLLPLTVLGTTFLFIRNCFLKILSTMKHFEAKTKTPVFSHLNSTLNGIYTIRASKLEKKLIEEFDEHQDTHTSSAFLMLSLTTSFGLWLDIICVVFVSCVIFSLIYLEQHVSLNGSLAALAIHTSIVLIGMLQYGIKENAEVKNQFTCVDRILSFINVTPETPLDTPKELVLPKSWPTRGEVTFTNFFLKYNPYEPPILKDLNIKIHPGEKIGIVGRTGAGKSSLISGLFKLTHTEGDVVIDNVNTNQIGLRDLRARLSFIPQEPLLFSATVRHNLDPTNEYEDDFLWNALEKVELKTVVKSLDCMVEGSNFSLGQKQLLCLARAIVRNNKILILDEATANVDHQTDSFIQATIRREFASCTVLTIAHRLNTVMDSDRVLVMDAGRIVEFDHPYILLQNPTGYFRCLVEETGSMLQGLEETAARSYNDKLTHSTQ